MNTYLCRVDGMVVRVDQRARHEADHAVQAKNTVDIAALQAKPSGGNVRLAFRQEAPAASWSWVHNLGGYPPVTLFTDDDPSQPVYTDLAYPDPNTVVIEWPEPTSGWAYI